MRWIKRLLYLIAFALVVILAWTSWWAAGEILTPSRRPLAPWHRDYLENAVVHGLRVRAFSLIDGTPGLLCEPYGNPGERGRLLRQQLATRGIRLPRFGHISGTVVMVHGRRCRKEDMLPIAERFCAAGLRCLIPDLPAHGGHPGAICTYGIAEADLPARVLREASRQFGFSTEKACLWGVSMGGAVSMASAAREDAPWSSVVLVSTFTKLEEVIETQAYRRAGALLAPVWMKGVSLAFHGRAGHALAEVDSIAHAAHVRCPVLIAHGTADSLIPWQSGRALHAALPPALPKRWVDVPGADHANVMSTSFPLMAACAEWFLRHP
jgi:pimeloyl-ACP methyl ester carboxylesterase